MDKPSGEKKPKGPPYVEKFAKQLESMKNFDFNLPLTCRDKTLEEGTRTLTKKVMEEKQWYDKQFEVEDYEPKVDLDLITREIVKTTL